MKKRFDLSLIIAVRQSDVDEWLSKTLNVNEDSPTDSDWLPLREHRLPCRPLVLDMRKSKEKLKEDVLRFLKKRRYIDDTHVRWNYRVEIHGSDELVSIRVYNVDYYNCPVYVFSPSRAQNISDLIRFRREHRRLAYIGKTGIKVDPVTLKRIKEPKKGRADA